MSIHIGYLTYGLDRNPTGIGRYAVELLRALARLTNAPRITLLTTEQTDRQHLWQEFERYPLVGCRLLPALLTLGNFALSRASKACRFDLIHDPNGIAPFLGPAAGARRLVTIHDAFAYVYPETHNRLDTWRYRWLLPRAASRADRVLTDSLHSSYDLGRYLGISAARLQVIPCGVDRRFQPVASHEARQAVLSRYGLKTPYLLYVGSINARKNIVRLFQAYALVRELYPDLPLVIGGKREWRTAEIDQVFGQLKLEQSVIFTGYIDDVDLPALYSAALAFVFPSLYEGFGLPVLEAMACGAPVICSQASALPEVAGDAALLVDPFDHMALANALLQVIGDNDLRARLSARGQARAAIFSWEKTAQATLDAYHDLCVR